MASRRYGYGIPPYLMTPLRPDRVTTVSQTSYQKAHMRERFWPLEDEISVS